MFASVFDRSHASGNELASQSQSLYSQLNSMFDANDLAAYAALKTAELARYINMFLSLIHISCNLRKQVSYRECKEVNAEQLMP